MHHTILITRAAVVELTCRPDAFTSDADVAANLTTELARTVTSSHTAPERPTSSRIGSRGVSVQLCYSFRGTPRQFNPPIKKHTFPSWLRDPPTTLYVPEGAHAGPIFVFNNKVDRFAGGGDLVREDVALLREGNGSRMSRYSSSSS
ncbi:hypothetical protein BHM03_00027507 [Ensete ventricosum]|nr:hypothetical protein BHM03_00027507 [Ensete ventricosum]